MDATFIHTYANLTFVYEKTISGSFNLFANTALQAISRYAIAGFAKRIINWSREGIYWQLDFGALRAGFLISALMMLIILSRAAISGACIGRDVTGASKSCLRKGRNECKTCKDSDFTRHRCSFPERSEATPLASLRLSHRALES